MGVAQTKPVHGLLLLYHHRMAKYAPTVAQHVYSFRRYSQFKVWAVNTALGFPIGLHRLQFPVIVLHYSLFGVQRYPLDDNFLRYLERNRSSYKIEFFQDEYQFCQQRFSFLSHFHIDCVYTLLDPAYFKDVYQKYTNVPKLMCTLTGYVSDDLIKNAQRSAKQDYARKIDVGYRGRRLPFYMGKGGQEKHEIAVRFREYASGLGLAMDIETDEKQRLYGDAWYKFLGDCKGCLGVEAGVSIFDTEDIVRTECERLIAENPAMTFEQMPEELLTRWEGNISYRTISPRHFEAAAFRVCQILYEGAYQGLMKPMVHYIPLKKDFSNFHEVVRLFRDEHFRQQITDNCYRDLIASGRYSYQNFIRSFDQELLDAGFKPQITRYQLMRVRVALNLDWPYRRLIRVARTLLYREFPGRRALVFFVRPVLKMYYRVIQYLKASLAN